MKRHLVFMGAAISILMAPSSRADIAITDPSGQFSVGIGPDGELFDYGSNIGFRRLADGYDPLALGVPRDSWGIAGNGSSAWADQSFFGSLGVTSTHSNTASTASYDTTTSNQFNVAQDYSFAAPNILQIATKITNTGATATDVMFQRDIVWAIAVNFGGSFMDDISFGNGTGKSPITSADAPVVNSSYNGFENPDPSAPYFFSCAAGCNITGDIGGGIDLNLGLLGAGQSISFNFFYGISNSNMSTSALDAEARALGVSYDILSTDINADASAFIGFGPSLPEPSSVTLAITALAGFCALVWYRRRRSA